MRRAPHGLGVAAFAAALACSTPTPDPIYRPTESVLEVLAVLRLHVEDDTYRFPPGRDFTGKNVFYASLARLERLEEIHAQKLASGYLLEPVLYAKGLALERMREYQLAALHYRKVAEVGGELAPEARRHAAFCERLADLAAPGPDPQADPEQALALFDETQEELEALAAEVAHTHDHSIVLEELERLERSRAEYFGARALLDPDLDALALQQFQRLVQHHPESKERNRHLLALADQYAALSRRYVRSRPPATLRFDPSTFDEYSFGATRLYEAVAQQDGAIEKIEAARKLEAFLAFTLQVHNEKLPRE